MVASVAVPTPKPQEAARRLALVRDVVRGSGPGGRRGAARALLVVLVAAGCGTFPVGQPLEASSRQEPAAALPATGGDSGSARSPVQAPALPGAQSVSSADRLYTADQTSNTVTVVDPARTEALGTVRLGAQRLDGVLGPQYVEQVGVHGLGFSRDGRRLGVVAVTTNSVTILDTGTNEVVSRTEVGRAPHEGAFSADGKEFWVAERGLDTVAVVDAGGGGVLAHIRTGAGPSKVVFSPDGRWAYVNHARVPEIAVVDVARRAVAARITGLADAFSSDMSLAPDGRELWAAHKRAGKTSVVDTEARRVLGVLDTGPDTNHPAFVTTGQAAWVYLTIGGQNQTLVYERNGARPRLVERIRHSGAAPHGIWPSPDNTRVYVGLEKSDTVDVIDTATRTVVATVAVGQEPQAVVYVAGAAGGVADRATLGRQGLAPGTRSVPVDIRRSPGTLEATIRPVDGVDMVQLQGRQLAPNGRYTAYGDRGGDLVPLVEFAADERGAAPQVLAFLRFGGVYTDRIVVAPSGQAP